MKFSFVQAAQWVGAGMAILVLVGLNFDYESDAGMKLNSSVEDRLSQGLLGYWKMDEGTGTSTTADASGNANTLSLTGPPTWATGQIGAYALDFSGTVQYLSVSDPASGILDFVDGADFTIVGWFNRDTFAADHTLVAKKTDQTTNQGYVLWVDNNGSTDYLSFELSDGTDTYSATGTTDVSATGWHHFAAVWNDTMGMYLYLDGKLDGSTTTSTSSIGSLADAPNTNAFRIGAESDAGVPFDGKIDDVKLYGKALSEDAVKRLYQTTVPGSPVDTGLVGHWTFDGPDVNWGDTGSEIKDVSGKGNHGASSANGATTFTSSSTFTPSASSITVECWGGGGASGGVAGSAGPAKGGGGAGGAYAKKVVSVTPGVSYTVTVGGTKTNATTGNGGQGNPSWFGTVGTVYAEGGTGGLSYENGGTAGTGSSAASIGDTVYAGGSGSNGAASATGGAGGGGAGTGTGGSASGNTAGTGTTVGGGDGAAGRTSGGNGTAGTASGGGGSGGYNASGQSSSRNGGTGARGQVVITQSGTMSVTPGKLGQGLSFNGTSDYVSAPLYLTGSTMTASLWIKQSDFSADYFPISADVDIDNKLFGVYVTTEGKIYIEYVNSGGNYITRTSTIAPITSSNEWYYVVVAFNVTGGNGTVSLYVNGTAVSLNSSTVTDWTGVGSPLITIGYNRGDYFKGKIDDVRIYNRLLSATEVADLYNMGR